MCAKPRAAPPPSASPMRGGFGGGLGTAIGGSVTGGAGGSAGVSGKAGTAGTAGGAGGTVWQAASSTTINAQKSLDMRPIVGSHASDPIDISKLLLCSFQP